MAFDLKAFSAVTWKDPVEITAADGFEFLAPIAFKPGDTGFASTGTHHVEPSRGLLLSSSYRWAKDEGPGDSSYVSRIDECPSA